MSVPERNSVRRSLLFTPANRPAAFEKGLASGADCLCIDLEDAVPPGEKDAVRAQAVGFLASASGPCEAVLRINPLSTRFGLDDLSAVARAVPAKGELLLPKTAGAGEVQLVASVLDEAGSDLRLGVLIESAEGLANADAIAQASPRLSFILFGAIDMSASLECDLHSDVMHYAASRVVSAAKMAQLDVLDVPELSFRDQDGVRAAAERARRNGFTGKAAIHPSNIQPINRAFSPSDKEIAEAQKIVAAYEASPHGLAVVDGSLVEAPVVRTMRRRLSLAAAARR